MCDDITDLLYKGIVCEVCGLEFDKPREKPSKCEGCKEKEREDGTKSKETRS